MVKQSLIVSLRTAKVEKDRRWVYNLVAWALKNHTKDYTTFQRRIQSTIYYAKGRYENYWQNPKNRRQHDIAQQKLIDANKKKYAEKSKKYNREVKLAYKLFREGKLSKKSTNIINKKMKNIKVRKYEKHKD